MGWNELPLLRGVSPEVGLLAALVLMYLSASGMLRARTGGVALAAGLTGPLAVSAAAVLWGRPDLALAVSLASAVSLLTLVRGVVIASSPHRTLPGSVAGQFVLPLAIMLHLLGFRGRVPAFHAMLLLAAGVAAVWAWAGERSPRPMTDEPAGTSGGFVRAASVGLLLAMAAVAGVLAVSAVEQVSASSRILADGLVVAAIVAAVGVLPLVGQASRVSGGGHAEWALRQTVGMVLALLGVVVPLVMLAEGLRARLVASAATTRPAATAVGVRIPLALWRVETVALVVLGLPLLLLSLRSGRATRRQGLIWIAAYVVYMSMVGLTVGLRRAGLP